MYSVSFQVPAPIEAYDALHAAVVAETDSSGEGLLVHIAKAVDNGFEITEVWESKEQFESFMTNTLPRALSKLPAIGGPAPQPQEFELRGFLVYSREQIIQ